MNEHLTSTKTAMLLIIPLCFVALCAACGGEDTPVSVDLPPSPEPSPGSPGTSPSLISEPVDPALENSLVYACIRSTACGVKPYPRISNCVAYYTDMAQAFGEGPIYDSIYRCANRSRTCGGLEACYGVTGPCGSSFQARCDNGKAVFCDLLDKTTMAQDCAAVGMTCQTDAKYGFAAKCVPAPGAQNQASPEGGLKTTVDCADGRCQLTGQPCSEDDLNRCSGAGLQACLHGQWVTFSCDKLNLGACQEEGGGWARCSAK